MRTITSSSAYLQYSEVRAYLTGSVTKEKWDRSTCSGAAADQPLADAVLLNRPGLVMPAPGLKRHHSPFSACRSTGYDEPLQVHAAVCVWRTVSSEQRAVLASYAGVHLLQHWVAQSIGTQPGCMPASLTSAFVG